MLGAIKDRFQRVKNNITGTGEKSKHHPSPSVPAFAPTPGSSPGQPGQPVVFPKRRSSLSAASAAAHLAHASHAAAQPRVDHDSDHGHGYDHDGDQATPLTRPRLRAPGVHQPSPRPYSAVFPSASSNPPSSQFHAAQPTRPVSMNLDPAQLASIGAGHPDHVGQQLAHLYRQQPQQQANDQDAGHGQQQHQQQPVPPTQQARVVYRIVQRPGQQPEVTPVLADANGHAHPIASPAGHAGGARPLPTTPSPLAQAANMQAQQQQQQGPQQQQQQQRTIADTRGRSASQSSLRVPIHMRHPKPAVSVASSSARNSTSSTASTATANRSQQQPQGRTLQKKRSSTTLAMAKLQANVAAPAAARRIRRKPVGSVRSVHPDIEFDSQQASSDEHNGRLEEGQVQSEYFESVNGQSAGTATPGIVSSNVSDDDEDDGDEQWELAPDQTIPRSPSPTLHRQQTPRVAQQGGFHQHQQQPHQHQHHQHHHQQQQQSPYMLHHPQFHAHLHGGGGASPAASNRTSVASSQYGGVPGTPSMSVVTTDVSSLNSSVLANAAALDRSGDHRRPSSGISDRPAHYRHSNLTDYSSIRSAQVSEMGGPSSSGAAGGRTPNGAKSSAEPVMQVSPTSTHVKFDSTRGRLSGCLVFTVRVAGVPTVADKPKPQALLGSPRDPTIIVEGKAEPTTNTWAWMGGSSTGSVRSNNAGGSVRRRAQAAHKQVGSIRGAGPGAPNLNALPVRSSLRGANPEYFMGSVRSMRSVTFALEAEAEREMMEQQRMQQQQPAKKHTVQINFEFGRNKLTENRRSLIVSLKFTLRVASMQVPYTAQAPVQWNRASRISFKRVPVMDLNCVSLFRETPQKSIGHNLSFRYPSVRALYSPAASSTDNFHAAPAAPRNASPSAGKRSIGRRQRHKQAVKSPHGSLRGSLRHMPPSLAMRAGAGSLRKKTSHTNLLAAMAAGTPAAAHPHAAAAAQQAAPRNQSPLPHLYHRRRRSRIPESWMFGQSAVGESPGPSDIEFYQGGNSVRSGMSNVLARSLPPPPPSQQQQATTGQRVARRAPDSVRSVGPEIKFDCEEVAEEHEYDDYAPGPRASHQQQHHQHQQQQQQQPGRGGNGGGPQHHQQQQYMMSAMGPQYSAPNAGGGGVQGGNQFDYAQQQQQPGIMFQQHHMQHQQPQSQVPMLQGAAADPENPMSSMGLARNVYTQVRAWNDAGHSSMDQPQQQNEQQHPAGGPDGAHQFPIDYSAESSGASYAHHSSMFDGVVHHHHHHGAFVVHDGQGHAHVMADYGSVASSTGDKGSIVSTQ